MMKNPKTTIVGWLAIIGAITTISSKIINGQVLDANDLAAAATALTGIGLIFAADSAKVEEKIEAKVEEEIKKEVQGKK
jgi:hypothetical protein